MTRFDWNAIDTTVIIMPKEKAAYYFRLLDIDKNNKQRGATLKDIGNLIVCISVLLGRSDEINVSKTNNR